MGENTLSALQLNRRQSNAFRVHTFSDIRYNNEVFWSAPLRQIFGVHSKIL